MKTVQILERPFYDGVVRQNHKTGFLNMNDLVKIGNNYRLSLGLSKLKIENYWNSKATNEFIEQVMDLEKISIVKTATRGRNGSTWIHSSVFMDMAMWINPKFKAIVMRWLFDNLLLFRDESGESYKKMSSSISEKYKLNGGKLGVEITRVARKIKVALKVTDWNTATEEQLKQRDQIHKNIMFGIKIF